MNSEVHVAKKCYQIWQKVAKVAKSPQIRLQGVFKGFQMVLGLKQHGLG